MAYLRHSSQSLPAFSIQPPSSSSSSGTAETPGQSNAASSVSQTANTQSTVVASTDPVSPRTLRPSHPQATGSQRLTPDEISELPMIPDSPPPSFDEAVGLVPLSSGSHASLASLNSATQASSLGGVSRSGSLNRQRIRYNTSNASLSSQGGQGGQGGQGVRLFSLARNDSAVRDEEDEDEEDEDDGNISLTFGPRSHPTFRNHEDDRVQISAQQLRTYSNSSRRRNSGGQGQAHSRSNSRAFATPAPGPSSQQHRHSSSVSSVSSAGSVSSFLSDHSGTPLTISGSRASQPAKPPSYSASSRSSSSTNLQNFSNLHINHPHPASSSSSSTPTPTILDSGTSPETFSTLLSHLLANNSTTNTNTAPGIISSTTNPSDLIDPALLAYPTISDHLSGARRSNRRTGSFSSSMQNRNRAAFSFAQSTAAVPLASASSPSLNTLGHSASPILHHPTPIVTSSGNQSPFPFSQRQLEDISTYFEYLQQQHLKIQGQLAIEQQVTQNHTQNAPTTSNTNIGSVDNRIAQQIPAVFSTNPNDQLESHIQFLQQLHQHQQHQQLHHRHSQGNISSAPRPESSGSVASPNNQHTRSLSNTQQRENCSQNSGDAALDITPLSGGGGLHDAQNTATSTSSSTHTKPDVHRRRTVSDPISRQQELLTPNQSSASPLDPVQTPTTGPNNKGSGSWFFFSRYAYEDPQGEEQRNQQQTHLKYVGRRIFNARFHFLLGLSRILSILPATFGGWSCLVGAYKVRVAMSHLELSGSDFNSAFLSIRFSQLILACVWCIVSGYLAYAVLDGLMDRWLITYSTPAVIVRLVSSSALNIAMTQAVVSVLSPDLNYKLHVWILISCILTVAYTVQNFITSNLALEKRKRSVDLYNIAVFAVVPVGLASFFTMLAMMRSVIILEYQYDEGGSGLYL